MKAHLFPHSLKGSVDKIYSKSYIHRFIICFFSYSIKSLLSCTFDDDLFNKAKKNLNTFIDLNGCIDTKNTFNALDKVFCHLRACPNFNNDKNIAKTILSLNCDDSASTARMLIPLLCVLNLPCKLYVSLQLKNRLSLSDFDILTPILKQQNLEIKIYSENDVHCIELVSNNRENNIFPQKDIKLVFDDDITSQVLSGVLLSSLLFEENLTIEIKNSIPSYSYINMTLEMLKTFGIYFEKKKNHLSSSKRDCQKSDILIHHVSKEDGICFIDRLIPIDYSLSATWVCANFLAESDNIKNYPIFIEGFEDNFSSSQEDKNIVEILNALRKSYKKGATFHIDCNNIPDIVPLLCLCASYLQGQKTVFFNISRLKKKESDRVYACKKIASSLSATFIEAEDKNSFSIIGNRAHSFKHINETEIDALNDHRIVMAFALFSLLIDEKTHYYISKPLSTNKSYKQFWNDFRKLGGKFDIL